VTHRGWRPAGGLSAACRRLLEGLSAACRRPAEDLSTYWLKG